jgi:hypothetical protein
MWELCDVEAVSEAEVYEGAYFEVLLLKSERVDDGRTVGLDDALELAAGY